MKERFAERLEPGCLSELDLDRVLADEPSSRKAVEAHLSTCERCQARLSTLRAAQQAFLVEGRVQRAVEEARRVADRRSSYTFWRRLRPAIWAPAAAVALAASVLAVLFAPRSLKPPGLEETVRTKGTFIVQALIAEKDRARPLTEHDRLRAGDRLLFQVSTPRPAWVFLISVDPRGPVTALSPQGTEVPPRSPYRLPFSAELDRSGAAEERVLVFCCERSVDTALLLRLTEAAYPKGPDGQRAVKPHRPLRAAGCVEQSILLNRARPDSRDGR